MGARRSVVLLAVGVMVWGCGRGGSGGRDGENRQDAMLPPPAADGGQGDEGVGGDGEGQRDRDVPISGADLSADSGRHDGGDADQLTDIFVPQDGVSPEEGDLPQVRDGYPDRHHDLNGLDIPCDLGRPDAGPHDGPEDRAGMDMMMGPDVDPALVSPNRMGEADYVIVTPFVEAFEELARWRRALGYPSRVVDVEEIYASYPGRDEAEQVRNYLKEAWQDYGTRWVLLGGDTPQVPHRQIHCEANVLVDFFSGDFASDLYFADLDGDWDGDGDSIFAEVDDGLDLRPDLWVGRAPVSKAEEAALLIDKVLAYEREPPEDYLNRVLFISEDTGFLDIDSAVVMEPMSRNLFPEYFEITKLYEKWESFDGALANTREAQLEALNRGQAFVNHLGHGSYDSLSFLDISDVYHLENGERTTVYVSSACFSGGFQWAPGDTGGEQFMVAPEGGGVAYIGNTDLGIGFPSGLQAITEFFRLLFEDGVIRLGEAFGVARRDFTSDSKRNKENHPDRWTTLGMVLFGDPLMPIWAWPPPRQLEVEAPSGLVVGVNHAEVWVFSGAMPVVGAVVTFYRDPYLLVIAETDGGGRAEAAFLFTQGDPVLLTVSAPGHLPFTLALGEL